MVGSTQPGASRVRGGLLALGAAAIMTAFIAPAIAQDQPPAQGQAKQAQPAQAQAQSKQAQPKAAPAGQAQKGQNPAQGKAEDNAWVKLCDKVPQADNKEICLTHHERLDGNSGMVLVAAAIRKVEGQDKSHILVTIPTAIALAIPAGVQLKIDEQEPMAMKYSFCYATSCQAEAEVTPDLLDRLRKGTQLVVAAMNMQRKAVGFPVPLQGFGKAYDGAPIDSAKYQAARENLMKIIQKRQQELAQKAAEAAKNKQANGGAPLAPQAGAQPPAAEAAPKAN